MEANFKDDIITGGGLRKYRMINNDDGTVSFKDVTDYDTVGTEITADTFNTIANNITHLGNLQAYTEAIGKGTVIQPKATVNVHTTGIQIPAGFRVLMEDVIYTGHACAHVAHKYWIDGQLYVSLYNTADAPMTVDATYGTIVRVIFAPNIG